MRKLALIVGLGVAACSGEPSTTPVVENAANSTMGEDGAPAQQEAFSGPVKHQLEACKAAIAVIMGRDPKTMSGKMIDGDIAHISYVRQDDGKRWQNRCRADSPSKLTWAAFDAFGDGRQGRWRTEESISFDVKADRLTVTVDQFGEPQSETFKLSDLR